MRQKYITLDSAGIAQMNHRFRDAVPYVHYKHRSIQEQNYLYRVSIKSMIKKPPLLLYPFASKFLTYFLDLKEQCPSQKFAVHLSSENPIYEDCRSM